MAKAKKPPKIVLTQDQKDEIERNAANKHRLELKV